MTGLYDALVDDAGLFPPEQLDMAAALRRHARDVAAAHPMHSQRFLCPASRVPEALAALAPGERLDLAVVVDVPIAALASSLAIADPRVRVVAVEIRLPVAELPAVVPLVPPGARLWVESGWTPALEDDLAAVAAGVRDGGAKLRCGGVRQELFPTADELAGAIMACRRLELPWKATAGLHRAVRYTDPATGLHHHGFLNLLVAASAPDHDGVRRALEVSDEATLVALARALSPGPARAAFTAYGSCSTDEPVQEITRLGLI